MRIQELMELLLQLGVIVSEKTLRRWGESGIIKDHLPNLPGTGRGNAEDWPQKALEEAAAVWAIRHCGVIKPNALNTEMILKIKDQANDVYDKAYVICEIPPIIRCFGGLQPRQHPLLFKTQFVSAYGPKEGHKKMNETILLFPGETEEERADVLNKLVKVWIAAVEKVRYTERARKAGRDHDVWPITTVARVRLYLKASAGMERDPDGTVLRLGHRYYRDRSQLEKRENGGILDFFDDGSNDGVDDIVLYENGIDVRLVTLLTLAQQALDDFAPLPEGFVDFSKISKV
jgi:hypothetical protein